MITQFYRYGTRRLLTPEECTGGLLTPGERTGGLLTPGEETGRLLTPGGLLSRGLLRAITKPGPILSTGIKIW